MKELWTPVTTGNTNYTAELYVCLSDVDEDRAGSNVYRCNGSRSTVPATMDSLAAANIDSDVGEARAAVSVEDEVSGLCCGFRDDVAERHVVGWPAVEVDSDCRKGVGDESGAVLMNTDLCEGRRSYCVPGETLYKGRGRHGFCNYWSCCGCGCYNGWSDGSCSYSGH